MRSKFRDVHSEDELVAVIVENVYEIERHGEMQVPVCVYASVPVLEERDLTLK
ncbi:hypothetical protein [Natrinema gelatinilyticum]|uniref:hypothetical protein n=1 Tax=Natrinema gelatinilyticum TaxID=2961571 RepID=UPI0020C4D808|nr:hypothetical protein [Natrinema gelatinilyticum]